MGEPAGLAEEQLRALDRLRQIRALEPFYLAGGTAIAFHLAHRRSLDLDLFSVGYDVDLRAVGDALAIEAGATVLAATDAAVRLLFQGEPLDVVRYRYPPLEPPAPGPSMFPVAGLVDLAVMKLAAVARRGIRRDFWDLRALCGAGIGLGEAAAAYVRRFGVGESELYHVARALTYFDDAEKESTFPAGLTQQAWEEIQRFFVGEAPKLLLGP